MGSVVLAYLAALDGLHKKAEAGDMVVQQLRTLPAYLLPLGLENPKTQDKKTAQKILLYLIKLSPLMEKETAWLEQINSVFCDKFSRFCRNEVIIAVLREKDCPLNTLWKQLLARCREDIANATSQSPQPPLDWAREMPAIGSHRDVWKMLRDFILSPTMAYFDYKAVQSERNLSTRTKIITLFHSASFAPSQR